MTSLKILSADFELAHPTKSKGMGRVRIFKPSPEEETKGVLFWLAQVDFKNRQLVEILDNLAEEFQSIYYKESQPSLDLALEVTLRQVNQRLAELLGNLNANWYKKITFCVGVIRDQEIHLSYVGNVKAFLFHQDRIIDIIEEPLKEINPLKVFAYIISGRINPEDTILIVSDSILDFFSPTKLKEICTSKEPQIAYREIEKKIQKNLQLKPVIGLIFQFLPSPAFQKISMPLSAQSTQTSMEGLKEKEALTEEMLTTSFLNNIMKNIKKVLKKGVELVQLKIFKKPLQQKIPLTPSSKIAQVSVARFPEKQVEMKQNVVWRTISSFIKLIRRGILMFYSGIKNLLFPTSIKYPSPPKSLAERVFRIYESFLRLNWLRKSILIIGVILIYLLSQNLANQAERKIVKIKDEEVRAQINQIYEKINSAQAAFIYEDITKAQDEISAALNLFNQLPLSPKFLEDREKLKQELDRQIDKIFKRETINNTKLIVTIENYSGSLRNIYLMGENLYVGGESLNQIVKVNLSQNMYDLIKIKPSLDAEPVLIFSKNTNPLILTFKGEIKEIDISSNKISVLSFPLASLEGEVFRARSYLNRIYNLVPSANQIFRHDPQEEGFAKGIPWLKEENMDLSSAQDLAIDGNIFVLTKEGKIIKFFQGLETPFELEHVEPMLENPTRLWTDENSDKLYILDPSTKRIIVYDKEGKLIKQYYFSQLEDIKDFQVKEKENKFILLAGNQIIEAKIK